MPLFHQYYTIHDTDKGRIGYVPTSTSPKGPLEAGIPPVKMLDQKGKTSKIILITTLTAAGVAALTLAIVYGIVPAIQGNR